MSKVFCLCHQYLWRLISQWPGLHPFVLVASVDALRPDQRF